MLPATQTAAVGSEALIMPHLAFVGRMGSGKSTCAEALGMWAYDRISFADKVREVAVSLYGEDARYRRGILQRLGHGMRALDEDVWVNAWHARYRDQWARRAGRRPGLRCVVDDCRYWNEYDRLRELGFVFVRVEADRDVRVRRLQSSGKLDDEAQLEHVTEAQVDRFDVDFTIHNNPGDYDWEDQLVAILNKVSR
jgi:dephospho-CoA kinase